MKHAHSPRSVGVLIISLLALGCAGRALPLTQRFSFDAVTTAAAQPLPEPWLVLRGDWFVTPNGKLRTQRTWPSDSAIVLDLPLRFAEVRVDLNVTLGPGDTAEPQLQSGEVIWGGGGIADTVGVLLHGPETGLRTFAVSLALTNGHFETSVDGKIERRGELAALRSWVNCRFGIRALPNAEFDDVVVAHATQPPPALAGDNRRATIDATAFLNRELPDCGFQSAIDTLPPTGGAVILPAGTFVMRRHLQLPSYVTLRGQGAGQTVLQHADTAAAKLLEINAKETGSEVVVDDASAFRVGDVVCFNHSWGHPGTVGVGAGGNRGVRVLGKDGDRLLLSEPPPARCQVITHAFPLVYARLAEYVEVKDLTLCGPLHNAGEAAGGFMNNLITFGAVAGARIMRVEGRGYPGDGVSVQGGSDAMVVDNTITGTVQAFHPGTTTLRFLWSRNLAADNVRGVYFCWYNSHGVYTRSTFDGMSGFPGQGDFFNVLAHNHDTGEQGLLIEQGASSVYWRNQVAAIQLLSTGDRPGKLRHLYAAAPRYFVVAENHCASITCAAGDPGKSHPAGNLIANGPTADTALAGLAGGGNVVVTQADPPDAVGCGRQRPVAPPELPAPLLDGLEFYDAAAPDCGFQAALDQLAATGGSLRLPGGRYPLRQALLLPSGVTLCGQGLGTVLIGGGIRCAQSAGSTIRELTIEGGGRDDRPAIEISDCNEVTVVAVDIRGWPGDGIAAAGSRQIAIRDSRVSECEGRGYVIDHCAAAEIASSTAIGCGTGFALGNTVASSVYGCIAARNGDGFVAASCTELRFAACNANHNRGPIGAGLQLARTSYSRLEGCMAVDNRVGILLADQCRENVVQFNRCGDDNIVPLQTIGISETAGAVGNVIRCNVTAPHHGDGRSSIASAGSGSTIEHNVTRTVRPTGSSIEEWPAP